MPENEGKKTSYGGLVLIDRKNMIKIYWVSAPGETREHLLIRQGLANNPRVELVKNAKESDFVFLFAFHSRNKHLYGEDVAPPGKTVLIDYVDSPRWINCGNWLAYFKRSWVDRIAKDGITVSISTFRSSNFHPLTMAIMDEFIIREDLERDYALSCSLRKVKRHYNRRKVLKLLEGMRFRAKTHIGEFNRGTMRRFNASDMRDYFRLLRRSKIVVTCNPGKWEGDHRTWEAFANGALVFVDRTLTPLAHPLIDGEHCIFYDLSDRGLRTLRERIYYYLDRTDKAERIARAGHEFAMKYHRASNRIDEILEVIT